MKRLFTWRCREGSRIVCPFSLPPGSGHPSVSHLPRLWTMVTQPWELVQRCRDGWASTCPLLGSKVKTLSVLSPCSSRPPRMWTFPSHTVTPQLSWVDKQKDNQLWGPASVPSRPDQTIKPTEYELALQMVDRTLDGRQEALI